MVCVISLLHSACGIMHLEIFWRVLKISVKEVNRSISLTIKSNVLVRRQVYFTSLGVPKAIFLAEMIEKGVKKNIITDFQIFGRDPGIPVQKSTGNNTKWHIAPILSIFC